TAITFFSLNNITTSKIYTLSLHDALPIYKQEIEAFVEKPKTFVSDLAIIGVYYFNDGENLRKELQRLIDEDIKQKGEYQITDAIDRKSTRLNSSHVQISYAVFCLKKKNRT